MAKSKGNKTTVVDVLSRVTRFKEDIPELTSSVVINNNEDLIRLNQRQLLRHLNNEGGNYGWELSDGYIPMKSAMYQDLWGEFDDMWKRESGVGGDRGATPPNANMLYTGGSFRSMTLSIRDNQYSIEVPQNRPLSYWNRMFNGKLLGLSPESGEIVKNMIVMPFLLKTLKSYVKGDVAPNVFDR